MSETERADVVIIGGGPAGLSAAVWCAELGLETLLLERGSDIGGQLAEIYGPIENYLGRRAANGREMLEYFRETSDRFAFTRRLNCEVRTVETHSRTISIDDGEQIAFRCLIIATGVRRRRLGVTGEEQFRQKGILDSGMRDRSRVAGKKVVIVGGGDAAIENALILSEVAGSVTVVHRRNVLTARDEFVHAIRERNNIELLFDTVVTKIEGDEQLSAVHMKETSSNVTRKLPADALLIRIGVEPNSELVSSSVTLDDRGYISVDSSGASSARGVYAVGDVANPKSLTLQTAAGTASHAAKSLHELIKIGF